jgi:HPt (histidine-containing phosphotransfer) domain-containing protein
MKILRSVWEHQQGRVNDRIDSIERAVSALVGNRLDADLRADAERAAHMLAGSLGMFGFADASDAARECESELARPTPDHAAALLALAHRLRSGVQGPVVLCSNGAADQSAHRLAS